MKSKNINNNNIKISVISVILFVIIWEAVWQLGYLNDLFFSGPSQIFVSISDLLKDDLFFISFLNTVLPLMTALSIASLFSITIGIFLGFSNNFYYALRPFIYGFNSMPKIVLLPIFILWFGLDNFSKFLIIFITIFVPLLINVIEGTRSVDKKIVKMANSFKKSKLSISKEIYFYTIAPFFLVGLRSNVGKTIGITIISEYSGVGSGLGRELAIYSTRLQTDKIFALALILIFISLTTIFSFDILYKRVFRKIK